MSIESEITNQIPEEISYELDKETNNQLIALVSELGRFSEEELSNRTNIDPTILRRWCNDLCNTGGIENIGGKWMIRESFERKNPFCC